MTRILIKIVDIVTTCIASYVDIVNTCIASYVDIITICIASYVDIITICIASYVDIVYVHIGMILSIMYFINIIYFKLCKIISHVLYVYQHKFYWFIPTYYIICLSFPLSVLGVTQEMYRRMVSGEEQFDWQCTLCSIPNVEAPDKHPPPHPRQQHGR